MNYYTILKKLGSGSFGQVYLCEKNHNLEKAVIKEINVDENQENYECVKNEIKILKSLKHANVIAYHDSYWKKNSYFIVMEFAFAGTLYELIQSRKSHLFEKTFIISIFTQLLHGLNHVHQQNIIHRDLKTENIFLSGPHKDIVKIGDFGISKLLMCSGGQANTQIGTINYLAPEICDGQYYDSTSDVWALGCILYEMCALERMFDGAISTIIANIKSGAIKKIDVTRYGPNLQYIINKILQVDPKCRPTTDDLLKLPNINIYMETTKLNIGIV